VVHAVNKVTLSRSTIVFGKARSAGNGMSLPAKHALIRARTATLSVTLLTAWATDHQDWKIHLTGQIIAVYE
jgi:hypothetical protein